MSAPARIVLFLGGLDGAERTRYMPVGDPDAAANRASYLPWSVLIPSARGDDPDRMVQVLVVGSQATLAQWVEQSDPLEDDLCEAGHEDRALVPVGFVGYDDKGLATGKPGTFWGFFDDLRQVLEGSPVDGLDSFQPILRSPRQAFEARAETIIVDITRGFRAAPFIGAAALGFARSSSRRPAGQGGAGALDHRIYYAALASENAYGDDLTPVWDLTPFLDAVELGDALDAFDRHGRADDLADFFSRTGDAAARELAQPMRAFADDLLWMRIPYLLSRSAPGLHAALGEYLNDLKRAFPPVADDLDRLDAEVRELVPDGRPVETVGLDGLAASMILAKRLRRTGRYAELYNLMRETLLSALTVTLLAEDPEQPCGGTRKRAFKRQRWVVEHTWPKWRDDLVAGDPPRAPSDDPPKMVRPDPGETFPADAAGVLRILEAVTSRRNDVAHCSMRPACQGVDELLESVAKSLEDTATLIRSLAK